MKTHSNKPNRKKTKHGHIQGAAVKRSAGPKKVRRRRRVKATRGSSTLPFGFNHAKTSTKLVANGPEAETVREIVERAAQSDEAITTATPATETRCAIYTRLAVVDEDEGPNRLEEQRERCRAFIEQKKCEGWTCAGAFEDAERSGANLNRPGFRQLMREVAEGKIHAVVVTARDRLSRNIADHETLRHFFAKYGVVVYSIREGAAGTTAMDAFTRRVLDAAAELERGLMTKRIREKVLARAMKGLWKGGTPPYGYDYDVAGHALRENPKEASVVRFIFSELAAGRELRDLVERLLIRGMRMRRPKKLTFSEGKRAPQGRPINVSDIRKMITDPIHRGVIRGRNPDAAADDPRVPGYYLEFPGLHNAIVSEEQWKAANAALK